MNDSAVIESLAAAIHEHYRAQAKIEGWTMQYDQPWDDLPRGIRESNFASARRISEILRIAGIQLEPNAADQFGGLTKAEAAQRLETVIDSAAEKEHEGWMEEKSGAGWTYAPERDDDKKQHPSLVPWDELSEKEKEKDRSAVRGYLAIVERAGMGLSGN